MRTIKCLYAISVLVVVVLTSCAYRPKVIVESESIVVESHIDSSYLGNTLVYEVHLASFDEDNCPRSSQDEELAQVTASLGSYLRQFLILLLLMKITVHDQVKMRNWRK